MDAGATNQPYIVLARKYRSRTFAELIGQDALVRTLSNAITTGKIHHAYVLTGIRGTGKTSTARLLAMALNCDGGPSTTWAETDAQVAQIRAGLHPDVLEFDAASNRGVEDVEKLFEGVAYAPVVGRYKVYIIDEVHMLSTTAFNALLKTLEEPPPGVVFIFATTEVHKIPITVLSRCQRFDLRRIPTEVLEAHFNHILAQEKIEAEPAAVRQLAAAADGSVRDGLSLLDQAIALAGNAPVSAAAVAEMLGLADREQVWALVGHVLAGHAAAALQLADDLYAAGQDGLLVLHGLLEAVHVLTRAKLVPGLLAGPSLSELERAQAGALVPGATLSSLNRVYQVLFQGVQDVKDAPRPHEAFGMVLVRAAHIGQLPPLDALVGQAQAVVSQPVAVAAPQAGPSGGQSIGAMAAREVAPLVAPAPAAAAAPVWPASWSELVRLVGRTSPSLAAALAAQVRCPSYGPAAVQLAVGKGLHAEAELLREVRAALRELGFASVAVQAVAPEQAAHVPTVQEDAAQTHANLVADVAASDELKDILALFPGAAVQTVMTEGDGA